MSEPPLSKQIIALFFRFRKTRTYWSTKDVAEHFGISRQHARLTLKELCRATALKRTGGGCMVKYRLFNGRLYPDDASSPKQQLKRPDGQTYLKIIKLLRQHNPRTAKELATQLGISRVAVNRHLRKMVQNGEVEAIGNTTSAARQYRLKRVK